MPPPSAPNQSSTPNAGSRSYRRITAVIPCFARQDELAQILSDLETSLLATTRGDCMTLRVVVVDNGSPTPLDPGTSSRLPLRAVRSPVNLGGSGGFNLGMATALEEPCDAIWLLDSDARVLPHTLQGLVEVLDEYPDAWAAGPALSERPGVPPHEVGGRVDRIRGTLSAASSPPNDDSAPRPVDYVASCCLLAGADAVRAHGLMPDLFLNGDDAQWCVRISRVTGRHVLVAPRVTAFHPRFDRHATWARFYQARNGFGVIQALGLPRRVLARRALVEVGRAINQSLLGRDEFARLHLDGLRAALAGDRTGASPAARLPPAPHTRSADVVDGAPDHSAPQKSVSLVRRLLLGPPLRTATVPAKGGPDAWLQGRTLLIREGNQTIEVPQAWPGVLFQTARRGFQGVWLAARFLRTRRFLDPLPSATSISCSARAPQPPTRTPLTLSVVVLSYNRADALATTLRHLAVAPQTSGAEIIVVDNHSTDGSADMVERDFPSIVLVRLGSNIGVAGFNRGVARATGDVVLILDDDARPDPSLASALDWMESHPSCGAVPMLPRHPSSGESEWPFAESAAAARLKDCWPVMGAGNLVRRAAWCEAGGYEERFFLYRNDTDLAMKLLASGWSVAFRPEWTVWHDSPAARSKSARWCRLATRNWLWVCRRHGRGLSGVVAAVAGWAWAHRTAGLSIPRQWAAFMGGLLGVVTRPPSLPPGAVPDGRALQSLLGLQMVRSGGSIATPRTVMDVPPPGAACDEPPPVTVTVRQSVAPGVAANDSSRARHSA